MAREKGGAWRGYIKTAGEEEHRESIKGIYRLREDAEGKRYRRRKSFKEALGGVKSP